MNVEIKKVEIFPRDVDLSKYIDSVEVEVDNFEDYHEMRKELRRGRRNEVH